MSKLKMSNQKSKRVILASGEGAHTHAVSAKSSIDYTDMGEQAIKFEVHDDEAVVTHEEHAKIVLEHGVYYKTNQVEFNPFTQTVSFVFD